MGTRFWPMSRRALPKQFLTLSGERSLIQSAFDLVQPWIPAERTWVVTNARFRDETQRHLPQVPVDHLLLEPCGRNTAPCVGLAALCLQATDPEATMLVMSADHIIGPAKEYQQCALLAEQLVRENPERLVLFGIPPTYPATGYGYIERGDSLQPGAFSVQSFREKPDRQTAESYLRDGRYFWNCGIFVWSARTMLDLLKRHEPEIAAALDDLRPHLGRSTWNDALQEIFPKMKSISIDYAVLEREQNIAVVEATFDWDDVGSWEAMTRLHPADESGNTVQGRFVGINTQNCIIKSAPEHLVATIGLDNCLIVQTPHATLVADRSDENAIRQLIQAIGEQGHEKFL